MNDRDGELRQRFDDRFEGHSGDIVAYLHVAGVSYSRLGTTSAPKAPKDARPFPDRRP